MKAEIIDKLKALIHSDDLFSIKEKVEELKNEYHAITDKQKAEQTEEQVHVSDPEDAAFEMLLTAYEEQLVVAEQHQEKEQLMHLKQKEELLQKLQHFIEKETPIGKAFQEFNAFTEKWKAIGDVPSASFHALNSKYQRLREDFFYKINIYKELKEYDLKVNHKRKLELIEKAKELEKENSIKNCELLVKQYQNEWNEIGASPQETFKELGNQFYNSVRAVYDKIQKHYEALKEERKNNLVQKLNLLKETKELVEQEITSHQGWVASTEKLKTIQDKWKKIGFTPRKFSNDIWKEFRGLCNTFFDNKNKFYSEQSKKFTETKHAKEALIAKAIALQNSENWKDATHAFLNLQKEWKTIGMTFQKDEQRLWSKFRAACDVFFDRKKSYFDKKTEENASVSDRRNALIEELKKFKFGEDAKENFDALVGFSERWKLIPANSDRNAEKTVAYFRDHLHKLVGRLIAGNEHTAPLSFEEKTALIKQTFDGHELIARESLHLRKAIERIQQEVNQLENNMGFFAKSKGASALKEELQLKVDAGLKEIAHYKQQLKQLNTAAVPA